MLLTEEEYRKKRCCQPLELKIIKDSVWSPEELIHVESIVGAVAIAGKCTASDCPAWRWSKDSKYRFEEGKTLHERLKPQSEWKGYCGIPGKVE